MRRFLLGSLFIVLFAAGAIAAETRHFPLENVMRENLCLRDDAMNRELTDTGYESVFEFWFYRVYRHANGNVAVIMRSSLLNGVPVSCLVAVGDPDFSIRV